MSFRAKKECPHCETDLFVRSKPLISSALSIPGFLILFSLVSVLQIEKFGKFALILFLVIGSLLYLAIVYRVICSLKGAKTIYIVDTEDPTVLERKKNQNKNRY